MAKPADATTAALFMSPVEYLILATLQPSQATRAALHSRLGAWHPFHTSACKEALQTALRRLEIKRLISSAKEAGVRIYRIEPSGIDAAEAFRNHLFA